MSVTAVTAAALGFEGAGAGRGLRFSAGGAAAALAQPDLLGAAAGAGAAVRRSRQGGRHGSEGIHTGMQKPGGLQRETQRQGEREGASGHQSAPIPA